jgi:hypothetical protein
MYINNAIYATRPQAAIVRMAHDSVSASKIFQLKTEIVQLWVSGKQNRVQTGHKLRLLQDALARHGHGTFLKTIKNLGIPRSTAYAYMWEAKVAGGVAGPVRLSKSRKVAPTNCSELQDVMMKAVRNHAKSVLGALCNKPDLLEKEIQQLLQATADDLLNVAGVNFSLEVSVRK